MDAVTRVLRIAQLWIGLAFYGISMDLMVRADLGLDSWDVLHQGLSELTGLSMGMIVNLVGLAVLVGWIPLRERPGFGTLSNALMVGTVFDLVLPLVPAPHALAIRIAMVLAAVGLCGLATGMYISVGWGAGPRDGLMVGIARRTGWSVRLTRTAMELTVLGAGWLLGGSVGIATVVFALLIGPASQLSLRAFEHPMATGTPVPAPPASDPARSPSGGPHEGDLSAHAN